MGDGRQPRSLFGKNGGGAILPFCDYSTLPVESVVSES